MPMRSLLLVLLAAAAAMPASAAVRSFPVAGFDRVRNSTPFNVRVHTGGRAAVRAQGPDTVLERLEVTVRNGELVIGTQRGSWFSGWNWRKQGPTTIDVSLPALSGVALAGPGDMVVDRAQARHFTASLSGPGNLTVRAVQAGSIDLDLSGPGDLAVAGRATTARLRLSGPGDLRTAGLSVRDADIVVNGPGSAALTASGVVGGALNGPGDITITGGARCQIRKSGPGDVRCR
jgi:hypothetical protein